ncbi:glycosyltransferase family 2 protein [Saccharopolyspora rosea]|uniref:Glycosyltransferase family 2 protein n=2 Tax=Saccharopolyspora rosea TaxID=524884 RepID=A0ABW3FXU3_9PSEU
MTAPHVSVVVPTRDKAPRLALTLACLAEQRDAPATEVVLVDDGCTDDTRAVAAAAPLPVVVVRGAERGRAAARNASAAAAAGENLVFLDDDVLVGSGFVAAHVAAAGPDRFVHGGLRELPSAERLLAELDGASAQQVRERRDALLAGTAGRRHRLVANALERAVAAMADGTLPDVAPWLGCVGANVSMSRGTWRAAGGFDEAYGLGWGCEDIELGMRLHRMGVRRVVTAEAAGIHLSHRRPDRWQQHDRNFRRLRSSYPVPSVEALPELLGPTGDPRRYAAAVREAERTGARPR